MRAPKGADSFATRPIITLTTDFGLVDSYVAAMKAVLLRGCPAARLIDVTHLSPRHDILCGSITLERAVDGFPPETIHLAVIDPGVGTDRRILVVRVKDQLVVCPDNGLITWSWRRHPRGARAHELTWRPGKPASHTFHGRDILAPAVAMLARGMSVDEIARPIDDPVLLDVEPAHAPVARGRVIHLDAFGNATTNVPSDKLRENAPHSFRVKGRDLGRLRKTYWDVAPGKPLALIGSSGLLEIAVRDGSAAKSLRLKVGDAVEVK
ncbi:MAG: SAM hydrolase/SAM-dependent halogenase family protein [Tepidisphaeraceae bacterium]